LPVENDKGINYDREGDLEGDFSIFPSIKKNDNVMPSYFSYNSF
jgi:hypothetical protein